MTMKSNNLVPIAMLWGTEELKAELNPNGDCERIIARPKPAVQLPDIGYIQYLSSSGGDLYELEPVRPPTWTWCETPTDDMAKLRPRCEVRDLNHEESRWQTNFRLVADSCGDYRYVVTRGSRVSCWRHCRVRLDANGEVMVDWEGEG